MNPFIRFILLAYKKKKKNCATYWIFFLELSATSHGLQRWTEFAFSLFLLNLTSKVSGEPSTFECPSCLWCLHLPGNHLHVVSLTLFPSSPSEDALPWSTIIHAPFNNIGPLSHKYCDCSVVQALVPPETLFFHALCTVIAVSGLG